MQARKSITEPWVDYDLIDLWSEDPIPTRVPTLISSSSSPVPTRNLLPLSLPVLIPSLPPLLTPCDLPSKPQASLPPARLEAECPAAPRVSGPTPPSRTVTFTSTQHSFIARSVCPEVPLGSLNTPGRPTVVDAQLQPTPVMSPWSVTHSARGVPLPSMVPPSSISSWMSPCLSVQAPPWLLPLSAPPWCLVPTPPGSSPSPAPRSPPKPPPHCYLQNSDIIVVRGRTFPRGGVMSQLCSVLSAPVLVLL